MKALDIGHFRYYNAILPKMSPSTFLYFLTNYLTQTIAIQILSKFNLFRFDNHNLGCKTLT